MNEDYSGGVSSTSAGQGFQQIDADAVCEQCGTVNDEGSLLCKVCGQNLRDQRTLRLAGAGGAEGIQESGSRFRVLTGLMTVLGIGVIILVVLNLGNIEAAWVSSLSEQPGPVSGDLWAEPLASTYDTLRTEIEQYPSSRAQIKEALQNPARESGYNGRYVLLLPGPRDPDNVVGEAQLLRRGNRVHFVALMRRPRVEVRGFGVLEEDENGVVRPVVRNTAGYQSDDGVTYGMGVASPLEEGGHEIIALEAGGEASESGSQAKYLAYRIR